MKDNIDNVLEFLVELFVRLLYFTVLMFVIGVISMIFIMIFNADIAIKVFCINMLIALIPLAIVFLLGIILYLIKRIIYGED